MKLVIMTKSTFFVEEDKILEALFDEGMDNLHLYKPGSSPVYSERLLTLLPEEHRHKITVHDHFYLKNEYLLAGIHLDDPHATPPEGYKGKYSQTITNLEDLRVKRKAGYVFLKNIFNCIEFPQEKSSFTLGQLEQASKHGLIDKRVYALGGIGIDNIRMVRDLGFGGVVICGDLWNRFDIHDGVDYKLIIEHFAKLRKAAS